MQVKDVLCTSHYLWIILIFYQLLGTHSLQRIHWRARHAIFLQIFDKVIYIFYIYIYAFSRCFYPKRLTVHSGYTLYCRYVYLLNGLMMSLKREVTIFSTLMEHDCDLKRYSTSHSTCHINSIAQEKHFWHSQLIPVELDISLLAITQSFYIQIKNIHRTQILHRLFSVFYYNVKLNQAQHNYITYMCFLYHIYTTQSLNYKTTNGFLRQNLVVLNASSNNA